MVMGQPVEKIIESFGGRKTSGKDLRKWLGLLGIGTSALKRVHQLPDGRVTVVLKTTTREGKTWKHWVIIEGDAYVTGSPIKVYDPCINGTHSYEKYVRKGYMDDSRFTSYFVIHATVDN